MDGTTVAVDLAKTVSRWQWRMNAARSSIESGWDEHSSRASWRRSLQLGS